MKYKDYSIESRRLATFDLWPDNSPVSPRLLAIAGFFCVDENTVVCFDCGGQFRNWKAGDNPFVRHVSEQKDCEFAKNLQVSQASTSNFPNNDAMQGQAQQAVMESTTPSSNSWLHHSHNFNSNELYESHHTLCDSQCPKDLNTEPHRLHTFYGWPQSTPVTPAALARQGFFYLGVRDKVECAFCGGVLHQWEEGDDPVVEHQRHYPHCPFVRARGSPMATSNVPLDDNRRPAADNRRMFLPPSTGVAETEDGFLGQTRQPELSSEHTLSRLPPRAGVSYTMSLPIEAQRPRLPDFADEESRLSTFFRWPLYSPISPRRLAQAGFVYTNVADHVRCYWCEGGLKDWQQDDDPWEEHARWYGPECGYVIMNKGMDYIRDIRTRRPPVVQQTRQQGTQQHVSYREDTSTAIPGKQLQQSRSSHQRNLEQQVNDAMDSTLVRDAVEMGFDRDDIRRVVYCQILRHGQSFATLRLLAEGLLNTMEDKDVQDQPTREESAPKETRPNPSTETQEQPLDPETMERELRRLREERQCKVCLSQDACMVFIPCGHLCCCEHCGNILKVRGQRCPCCKALIMRVQRAFLA